MDNSQGDLITLVNVFIVYAYEDKKLLDQLVNQLNLLEKKGQIAIWHDGKIFPGTDKAKHAAEQLAAAQVILLLISSDFIVSDNCYSHMEAAIKRYRESTALVIPVLLSSTIIQGTGLEHLKVLPTNSKPITESSNRKKAFFDVAKEFREIIEVIQEKGISEATKAVQQATKTSPTAFPHVWHIPYRHNDFFTGRGRELLQLAEALKTGKPQALRGMGGIGKTQIALEYAHRHRESYPIALWVNAATEATLISEFVTIADILSLPGVKHEPDQRKVVEKVKYWLERSDTCWLLIFDNADDITMISSFLPTRCDKGSIILTTRAQAVRSIAEPIEVKKMTWEEGKELLLRRAYGREQASDIDENTAGNIVSILEYFPLALDQAGAYIEETGCSLSDYLELYYKDRKKLLARRGNPSSNYSNTVATAWSLSFKMVEQANPAAADLLRLCAFLDPDTIPEEMIRNGASYWKPKLRQTTADPFKFDEAITELLKFSLVKRNTATLSIHRLVQAVLRDSMTAKKDRDWKKRVVSAIDAAFPEVEFTKWSQCELYLPHALLYAKEWIKQEQIIMPEAARHLLRKTGVYLMERARYEDAEPLLDRAQELTMQKFGPEHPNTALSWSTLAGLYLVEGSPDKAEPLLKKAREIYERTVGRKSFAEPEILNKLAAILNNLAALCQAQNRGEEAELLLQEVLEIRQKSPGPEHPDTATTLHNLGQIYRAQERYKEAERLLKQSLEIRQKSLGPEHLSTASSLASLALCYFAQPYLTRKRFKEAEQWLKDALEIRQKSLGLEHPDTVASLLSLANLYSVPGRYGEAEPLIGRGIESF